MQSKAEEIRKWKIDNMRGLFFSWGLQYYIASRCSHFAQLYPTTANQCHHAIEMFLKGFLYYRRAGETQQEPEKISNWLKNKYGHQLPKLWEAFKSETVDFELSNFDQTIAGLHQFENIRYPDEIAFKGGMITGGFEDTDLGQKDDDQSLPKNEYQFALAPIDRLVRVIFQRSSINPSFYTHSLNKEAATYLMRENEISYETRVTPGN